MALPQPLHIFRKDLTHLWPETLFVVLLFVAFAYAAPSRSYGTEYYPFVAVISILIKILMVVSWLVLIARSIQDEPLVGDRQFWTSRPYHWASLLAAKILLILTCIYVPFFLMQVYLLKSAGLYPTLAIPALLHNLVLLTVILVVPLAALSAVTSTFPRVLLSFIGAVIYIGLLVGFIFYLKFFEMQTPHLDWILNTLFIGLPAAVLVFQYKTRKTLISRLTLAAIPILCALVLLITPSAAIIARAYPVTDGPKLTSLGDKMPPQSTAGAPATVQNHVIFSLPVAVAGIDKDHAFIVRGTQAVITAPGYTYQSAFNTLPLQQSTEEFTAGAPLVMANFLLPASVYKKLQSVPVDLHLRFATEQLKADKPSTWHATLLPFSVPGRGICAFPTGDTQMGADPVCRYALQQPEISFATARLAAQSCSAPAAQPVMGQASVGSSSGATLDFDPVVTVPLTFQTGDPNRQHRYLLCPGTELTFLDAVKQPDASLVVDQKNIVLDNFAQRFQDPRRMAPGQPPPSASPEPQDADPAAPQPR